MKKVVFRVDASVQIGGGHAVRCAAVGDALLKRGVEVHFICRLLPGNFCDWLEKAGFVVVRLPKEVKSLADDIHETQLVLAALEPVDWLVIDHYGIDVRWEAAFRSRTQNIMVIDDVVDRMHDCDLLLNQNYIRDGVGRYEDLVPSGCHIMVGPRYSLLRDGFRKGRDSLRARDGNVRNLLICFGATDPRGYTSAAMQAVSQVDNVYERIDVVTSSQNPRAAELREECALLTNTHFHSPAEDLIGLMKAADLALGAGGTMNWERACLGLPSIVIGIADNQRQGLESLIHDGIVLGQASMPDPDFETMAAWLVVAGNNPHLLQGLSSRSAKLVDGHGPERVADALVPPIFTFRRVTLEDANNLFEWRTSAEVTDVSLSCGRIEYAAHKEWLKVKLTDRNCIFLLIEVKKKPVGVVRFDCIGDEAVISIYRVPGAEPVRGLVYQATEWLRINRQDVRRVKAKVIPTNDASLAAFRSAGYTESAHHLIIEL